MQLNQITSYEVKMSRTEQKIPVINGVHLHSIYDPNKEAENLVLAQLENLKNKNEILILGLGFAYHVNAIIQKLNLLHGENFKVIVIEPNVQVFNDCNSFQLLTSKNVLVYPGFSSIELYSDLNLIHFLLRKPAVIMHPPSFNLYQNYFKEFLTFEAPKSVKSVLSFITEPEIKSYICTFDQNSLMEDILYKEIPNKRHLEQNDFLAMALVEMTKKSQEKNIGFEDN